MPNGSSCEKREIIEAGKSEALRPADNPVQTLQSVWLYIWSPVWYLIWCITDVAPPQLTGPEMKRLLTILVFYSRASVTSSSLCCEVAEVAGTEVGELGICHSGHKLQRHPRLVWKTPGAVDKLTHAACEKTNVNKSGDSCAADRDPATPWWVVSSKCPLLSQHLSLRPALCLDSCDCLASTSSGNAVEDVLSIILPVKNAVKVLRSMWTPWLLIWAGNLLQDTSRVLLCVLADASSNF